MSARAALDNRASMTPQPVSLLCQYSTGILGPGEEGGGESGRDRGREDGPRRAEGRGEQSRGEQMSVVGGSCGPWLLRGEMSEFRYLGVLGGNSGTRPGDGRVRCGPTITCQSGGAGLLPPPPI